MQLKASVLRDPGKVTSAVSYKACDALGVVLC